MKVRSSTVFVSAASLGILIAVAAGLVAIGTPANIRLQRLDDARSQDLQNIVSAIGFYRFSHRALPQQLERVQGERLYLNLRITDVETGAPYEYRILDTSSYELCAQFATVSDGAGRPFESSRFWMHPKGRYCFTVDAGTPSGDGF